MNPMQFFSAAAALVIGAGVAMAADANDPVFYLSFDTEKDGAEVCSDRMKPDRVCKLINPKRITFADGKVGKTMEIDNPLVKRGTKEDPMAGVLVPGFWDADFAKAMSIEVWVKIAKDVDYRRQFMYIAQCGYQYGFGFSLFYNGSNIVFLSGTADKQAESVYVFVPVTDLRGEWTHIAATYDGEKKLAKVYINGEFVKETENFVITPPKNRHQPLRIGSSGNARGWRGAIDELKIYKRVLTPAEILEHSKFEL